MKIHSPQTSDQQNDLEIGVGQDILEAIPIFFFETKIGQSAHGKTIEEMFEEYPRVGGYGLIRGMNMIKTQDTCENESPKYILAQALAKDLFETSLFIDLPIAQHGNHGIIGYQQNDRNVKEPMWI